MKITMSVTRHGTPQTVTIAPVDIVAFERAFGIGFGKAFGNAEEMRLEHQLWMAWSASKRTGSTTESFDAWMAEVEEIGQEADATPLDGTPQPG